MKSPPPGRIRAWLGTRVSREFAFTSQPTSAYNVRVKVCGPLLLFACFLLTSQFGYAGSATWNSNPVDNNWNNAANWTPPTVPNGPTDVASFANSNITSVSVLANIQVHSIVFNPGADAFSVDVPSGFTLTLTRMGIVYNSTNPQTLSASGGTITFSGRASAVLSPCQVLDNGMLTLTLHTDGTVIGSLGGNGVVSLGSYSLSIGNNSLSTAFDGVIQDSGRLVKIGTGTLTLGGANTYTGGTIVSAGVLRLNNRTGSATGTGTVTVQAGTLGGNGTVGGAITLGTGNGAGAFLAPSVGAHQTATFTLSNALRFQADSTYAYKLNTRIGEADQVIADGITIQNGAQFRLQSVSNKQLTIGTIFMAISNTSANPIVGTFANLPDNSNFTAGPNNYQASYEGGDGNDLTLTVVP